MSHTECPYCHVANPLGSAGSGQTLRCVSCGRTFMVTSMTSAAPTTAPATQATSSAPAVPMHRPTTWRPAGLPSGGVAAVGATPVESAHLPMTGQSPRAAPMVANRDTKRSAAREVTANSSLLWWVGGVLCLLASTLLLMVIYLTTARQQTKHATRPTNDDDAANVVHLTPGASKRSGWADVAKNTIVGINRVTVEVDYVDFGEVRAKDANRHVIVSDAKDYLQIFLTINNHNPRSLSYASWYGNTFDTGGQDVTARLVDDQGRSYEMREFQSVSGVRGHTEQAELTYREATSDVVIFAVPSTLDRQEIRYFRLELPAEAYGGSGSYRFEIPRRAVQGF